MMFVGGEVTVIHSILTERNSMIISKNVVFNNESNILKTDVVEIDIKTKDTKFYMYDKDNKVSLIKNN